MKSSKLAACGAEVTKRRRDEGVVWSSESQAAGQVRAKLGPTVAEISCGFHFGSAVVAGGDDRINTMSRDSIWNTSLLAVKREGTSSSRARVRLKLFEVRSVLKPLEFAATRIEV